MGKLAKLREELRAKNLDGMLVVQPENRRYLSGFTGSAAVLLITVQEALLFTDFRYQEQAAVQAPEFRVIKHAQEIWDSVAEYTIGLALGFESSYVSFEQYQTWLDKFQAAELAPIAGLVEGLRSVKQDQELVEIERAVALADQAFDHIISYIEPGMTERQVALELEFFMRWHGASGPSFEFIVASGPRSSLPHGVATGRVINAGELITLDFGCVVNGYCSDITRTVVLGRADQRQQEIYEIVLSAQLQAIQGIRPGMTGNQIDQIARDIISERGFADNFGHGLGHAVGLAVHEEPRLSPSGNAILQPGMVLTVEPGIYLPGWGGVRTEDMVVITPNGCRVLTKAPKQLVLLA